MLYLILIKKQKNISVFPGLDFTIFLVFSLEIWLYHIFGWDFFLILAPLFCPRQVFVVEIVLGEHHVWVKNPSSEFLPADWDHPCAKFASLRVLGVRAHNNFFWWEIIWKLLARKSNKPWIRGVFLWGWKGIWGYSIILSFYYFYHFIFL